MSWKKAKELTTRIDKVTQLLSDLKEERAEAYKKIKITCPECEKTQRLGKAIFLQPQWYERPRGCTEGDNWWDCKHIEVYCPHCKHRAVYENDKLYDVQYYARVVLRVSNMVVPSNSNISYSDYVGTRIEKYKETGKNPYEPYNPYDPD